MYFRLHKHLTRIIMDIWLFNFSGILPCQVYLIKVFNEVFCHENYVLKNIISYYFLPKTHYMNSKVVRYS